MNAHRPKVMQSFRAPRATTNPYIVQLDRALAQTPTITHLRFDWKSALLTRVDVMHLHWPETLLGGNRAWKRLGKRVLFRALLWKLQFTDAAIVRTAHNLHLPGDLPPAEEKLLRQVEERTDLRILLNEETSLPWTSATRVIPHGHYVDWFSQVPPVDPEENRLGFVGLVRRYKGVEGLISAFSATAASGLRLRISGNPTSASLADEIGGLAASDPRIELDFRFLSEEDFATAIMHSVGVVLPYRFMHNSGTALAALSLDRPVLVPRTDVNTALSAEVGPGWVHMFDGDLDAADLEAFHTAAAAPSRARPRLGRRDWDHAGVEHAAAYEAAIAAHRERKRAGRSAS